HGDPAARAFERRSVVSDCPGPRERTRVVVAARRRPALLASELDVPARRARLHGYERLADVVERAVLAVGEWGQVTGRMLVLVPPVLDELPLRRRQRDALEDDLELRRASRIHERRVPVQPPR